MPTGYTAGVADGTITSFPEFAMRCARAFGALIEMRDSPMDAPIPTEFAPDSYYTKRIREGRERIAALEAMTPEQIAAAASARRRESDETYARMARENREKRARYEAMLAEVDAWTPPTPDHVDMKKFMREQLTGSIDFDCYDPERYRGWEAPTPEEWYAGELEAARRSLDSAVKSDAEERERAEGRTRWVQQLRASLTEGVRAL